MTIAGIDHVNIVTQCLDETVAFYSERLGLTREAIPSEIVGIRGAWLRDDTGAAIIHVNTYDPARHGPQPPGTSTGPVDHVALRASDFDGMLAKVAAMGLDHKVNDFTGIRLRQIFVTDPNHVRLEFNFYGD